MTAQASISTPNPARLDGIAFVEFSGADADFYADLFGALKMTRVEDPGERIDAYVQGDIRFVVNHRADSAASRFAEAHGPCISALGFRVADSRAAFAEAVSRGAEPLPLAGAEPLVDAPVLRGIGDSGLYLVDSSHDWPDPWASDVAGDVAGAGFTDIDHLTHNVRPGQMTFWSKFYQEIFGFTTVFEWDGKGAVTGMQTTAVMSPCGQFRIAINEPTEHRSQIQEFIDEYRGEGVQHLALASGDLYASLEALTGSEIPFQEAPESYYEAIDERLPGHGEDVERMRRLGILIDGDNAGAADAPDWRLLLQIFSKNLIGPIFFEFIQRKGNDGFGEGNAKALFESIEREQMQRGYLESA